MDDREIVCERCGGEHEAEDCSYSLEEIDHMERAERKYQAWKEWKKDSGD
jgi:hypothetical protein